MSNYREDVRKYHQQSDKGQLVFEKQQNEIKNNLSLQKNYKKDKENFFLLSKTKRIKQFGQPFFFSFDQWKSKLINNQQTILAVL